MELVVLSSEEMKNTEGVFGPPSTVGDAIISGVGNIGYQLSSGDGWDWDEFGYV